MIKVEKPDCGESIEEKLRKVAASNTPIEKTEEPVYTARKDGVLPQYDIRTDRFEIAIEACDKFSKSENAHRTERDLEEKNEGKPKEEQSKSE